MNKTKKGHRLMSFVHDGLSSGTLYPDPDAGSGTAPSNYGASTTAGDSPFAAAGKKAIIYSISVGGATEDWRLQSHTGTLLAYLTLDSGHPHVADFGPQGIELATGFRLFHATPSAGAAINVVYEVV
jgi:hypothetical protein